MLQTNIIFSPALPGLHAISIILAEVIGYIASFIIAIGCVRGILSFTKKLSGDFVLLADIRVELGHYLALGLEFLIAKDVIESLFHPTWNDIGKLAAIVILRTMLTLFLEHEVREVREELQEEGIIHKLRKNLKKQRMQR